MDAPTKIILFANTDWYLYNFRRSLARALREAGHPVLLLSPAGEYGPKMRNEGFRWQPVPMQRRSLNPWREALLVRHLCALFRRERPALVHTFTIKCAVYGSLAARLARVPARVNAVAGLGYVFSSASAQARLLRPLVRKLLRVTLDGGNARLILQNPDDVTLFEHTALVHPARMRLIRSSGVDCNRFAHRRPAPDDEPWRVLLAARLLWDKGIAEFVEAARTLRGDRVRFLLAGNPDAGNPGAVPEAAIRGWMREGLIDWLGHTDDMPGLLAQVDIVVLPSYYREGVPRTLIEAAACGLPLITTDMPGCREVVTDNVDGLLIPPRDAAALGRAILRLRNDPALARRLGARARAKALSEFDERIVIQRTLEVYRELRTFA